LCVGIARASGRYHGTHNIGVAMDTPSGLLVPNIKSVQLLSVEEISDELVRLQIAGSAGKLTQNDQSGTTFSLSNIGAIGGTYASPVIASPQVAIGALGRIQRLPRFAGSDGNTVVAAEIMAVSWAADHRIVDGATVARFSNQVKAYLEDPLSMLLKLR
jgi:2-oxoisovalerate dehydrogenase E2 component (dihydrolipoyl transacylase)